MFWQLTQIDFIKEEEMVSSFFINFINILFCFDDNFKESVSCQASYFTLWIAFKICTVLGLYEYQYYV